MTYQIADDSFLFFKMSGESCHAIKVILEKHYNLSNLRINYDKSKLKINKNCDPNFKRMFRGLLQVKACENMRKYLGMDIGLMNKKGEIFQLEIDTVVEIKIIGSRW